jgi:membrane protein implicated in regulation of membrane protease activity
VPDWLIWVIVAVVLAAGELATPGLFVLGLVAIAAGTAALVAVFGGDFIWQISVFVVGMAAMLGLIRPIARRHLHMPKETRTGTAALVGAHALVLERCDRDGGLVKIGGEQWTARAYMEDQVLEPGTRVEVARIEGATALVYE